MTDVQTKDVPSILAGIKTLAPGVYFNLDEDTYHGDPSLGSTSMLKLAWNPSDYWFNSPMNPNRPPDKDTEATIRGSAVHAHVLYGSKEFDKRYMRGAVHTPDMSPPEKGALTKAANAAAAKVGKTALPSVTYDNIVIASAMMAKNQYLANALVGGMNEVSIFWRDKDGIPKKARLDCLKPRGVGDLKSIANKYGKPFPRACIDSVKWDRKDVQAKHYMDARGLLSKLVAEGRVFGDHDAAALKAVCASKEYAWQWVWWQAEGAPVTYSRVLSPKNPIFEISTQTLDRACENYLKFMSVFGPDEMWLLQEPAEELWLEEMPYFGQQ